MFCYFVDMCFVFCACLLFVVSDVVCCMCFCLLVVAVCLFFCVCIDFSFLFRFIPLSISCSLFVGFVCSRKRNPAVPAETGAGWAG